MTPTRVFILLCLCCSCALAQSEVIPSHHVDGGFRNTDPEFQEAGFFRLTSWQVGKLTESISKPSADIPRAYNDGAVLRQNKPYTVTWIGQSTVLIQMEGVTILTDPVWSSRIGPVRWAGTVRASDPGLSLDKLPSIDIVLISHNHYDHLDEETIQQLAKNPATRFFVPLRVRDWFEDLGISNVEELDWWEGTTYKNMRIICAPAQHFSGRWLTDKNESLWASWMVLGKKKRFYFAGDSGLFSGFRTIGRKFDSFDLTILPIGSYEPRELLGPAYMNPNDALQAHSDLRGKKMLAVHWGTFKQTDEPLDEPPQRLTEEIRKRGLPPENYWIFMLGETREW